LENASRTQVGIALGEISWRTCTQRDSRIERVREILDARKQVQVLAVDDLLRRQDLPNLSFGEFYISKVCIPIIFTMTKR
jgi:hypothetical protein